MDALKRYVAAEARRPIGELSGSAVRQGAW
jgi:hypothetical protein